MTNSEAVDKNSLGSLTDPFDSPDGEAVRFTMTRELVDLEPEPPLPFGYRLEQWTEPLTPAYAAVIAVAFSDSPDLAYYPRLASKEGCISIVKEIVQSPGFISGASWIVLFNREPLAVILSSRMTDPTTGHLNLVAVAPRHRLVGVGSHLVSKSLWSFRDRRFAKAALRVNRTNRGAIRFFRSIGFQVSESRTYL